MYNDDYYLRDDYETGDYRNTYEEPEYMTREFENEIGAYDRTAYTGDEVQDISEGISLFKSKNIHITNQAEAFRIKIDAISRSISEYIDFKESDIINMSNYIKNISHPEFINPTGYILGHFITSGGVNINKSKLDNIFKYLEEIEELTSNKIKEPDVIRYCRFWINLRKNI